ncbi:hypothetical protein N0V83_009713 [Neocucurbitaria cava]|uniref:DUF7605 domain-containing protein n=1 Tax=Neocucurbitaria cava TaxID=798079 RepID=A0A9W9CI41_9PLEO|nr:hypothetical protein N0V83_009713 [Neocucurbitaria cava]
MKDDMSTVWDSFEHDLQAHLDQLKQLVLEAFTKVLTIALATAGDANAPTASTDNTTQRSAMRILAATLLHRADIVLHGLEKAQDTFFSSSLSSLHTDIFSSVRTAFIGKLMETTYHAANMEYGAGSDRRRKDLITGRISSRSLFNSHRQDSKERFRQLAAELQVKVRQVVYQQVELLEADLQTLRDENAVLDSERDPEFRRRVELEIGLVNGEVERLGRVVGRVV